MKLLHIAALGILLLAAAPEHPRPVLATPLPAGPEVPPAAIPSHAPFTAVLDQVVRMPRVDYQRLQDRREDLDSYLTSLARTEMGALDTASRDEQLAFWINAYNACMLKIVVDHYPIEPGGTGFFGFLRNRVAGYPDNSVWQIRDVFTRDHCRIAGALRSQDEIEHEIIRPGFDEPRIHFAVNCAAVSCPVLWPVAYEPDTLDDQLDRAVRHLMANDSHFGIERGSPATLRLNKVLDWYAEDFDGSEGLKRFFAHYLTGEERETVTRPDTRVAWFDYDWTLNDIAR